MNGPGAGVVSYQETQIIMVRISLDGYSEIGAHEQSLLFDLFKA